MGFVDMVDAFCERALDETAEKIESEMKGIVEAHWKSGAAYKAIHIEAPDRYTRLIGGTGGEGTKHLIWLDQGNGGGRIYPTHSKALRLTDGRGNTVTFAGSVRSYKGIHFLKQIASKYQ